MASFSPGNGKVVFTGNTEATLLSAPSAGTTRVVRAVALTNRDSVARDLTLRVDDGTDYDIVTFSAVAAGETVNYDNPIVLTSSDTLKVLSDAAATTTEPIAFASYADIG